MGGSRGWLFLGAIAWSLRFLSRVANTRRLRTVLVEELRPGESIRISHLPDDSQ